MILAFFQVLNKGIRLAKSEPYWSLFSVFAIAITALVISAVVRIHLIGAIVVICSVGRIVRIVLIRVVVKLATGMSITGHTFSFAHDINLLVSSDFIITQDY